MWQRSFKYREVLLTTCSLARPWSHVYVLEKGATIKPCVKLKRPSDTQPLRTMWQKMLCHFCRSTAQVKYQNYGMYESEVQKLHQYLPSSLRSSLDGENPSSVLLSHTPLAEESILKRKNYSNTSWNFHTEHPLRQYGRSELARVSTEYAKELVEHSIIL